MPEIEKRPPGVFIVLQTGAGERRLSLEDLKKALGITDTVNSLAIGLKRDRMVMTAALQPREADYPGIDVDASTDQAGDIYLGNFEFPCETYPTRIAARLYAGCHRYETDEPIAVVTHEVTDDARIMYRAGKYGGKPRPMHKLVYIDHDLADSRTWREADEAKMPEHQEDE